MAIRLTFCGAARNVTGSRHLLEADGRRILVDCGLYQERQFAARNWEKFAAEPSSIDAVLLTHAHLDHCGLLPKLVREGFSGPIYCTAATAEIAKIILLDAARQQEEDAEFKRRRHRREGRRGRYPEEPLYTSRDAQQCLPRFEPVEYEKTVRIAKGIEGIFHDAGHVLGSAVITVRAGLNGGSRNIVFSGDIGRPDRPIVRDPSPIGEADYVLIESTYGDRDHHETSAVKEAMAEVINSTIKAGGNIIVPSFALERSQEVLYYVNELLLEDIIPNLMVFLDSPMAASITRVFNNHPEMFDRQMREHIVNHENPFEFPGLKITEKSRDSKAINHIKGTVMVIAGSGMCTGGRVKHHLVSNISRPESAIMFVGYQASGTLGRRIVNGDKKVRILGREYLVKARIAQVHGFSAHADRGELLDWLQGLANPPRGVFVVHGEDDAATGFGEYLREQTRWKVTVPAYGDSFELD
jgi:metallo-beta-lactamase family protein